MRGRADFRKAKIVTPDATYDEHRFIYQNGRIAVWSSDESTWTADRILLLEGATFAKRSRASDPHIITLSDGTEWQVTPQYAGGCGCAPYPLKGISYTQLLDPDFSHIG